MTKEECIADLKSINATGMECIDYAIKVLEQQSSNSEIPNNSTDYDCVSRQAVVEYIKACGAELGHDLENESVREDILNMSPVMPTHGTCTELKAFSNELKGRMKSRDEDNGGEPLNAVDKGYHLAFEHLCKEIDSLLAYFEKRGDEDGI